MVVSQHPPRRLGKLRLIVVLVVVCASGLGLIQGFHLLLNPWATTLPGKPGLVGYWQGDVTYGAGDGRRVVLELIDGNCTRCRHANIEGRAKVCGTGHKATYEIHGRPENYRGTLFSLNPQRTSQAPGLYLNYLDGQWDGVDLLTISASLSRIDENGHAQSTISTDIATGRETKDPPDVRFELRRGSEADFTAAC